MLFRVKFTLCNRPANATNPRVSTRSSSRVCVKKNSTYTVPLLGVVYLLLAKMTKTPTAYDRSSRAVVSCADLQT